MRGRGATVYAAICTLLLIAGFLCAFLCAWQTGIGATAACVCGLVLGFLFAPVVHELGHFCFGKGVGFRALLVKCFCFKFYRAEGKTRLAFASPFAADQTQMLPKTGGNMSKRATWYTLGGLWFSGGFILLVVVIAILWRNNYVVWGTLPYAGYLFLLNVCPAEYGSGRTDTLVCRGIKKGYDAERCMLSAMEIQGQLSEGKAFGEVEERLYFDLPQLAEDEPLYSVLLDLRYRYYLDRGDLEQAADCLNRLALNEPYLSDEEVEKVAAELVYMHAIRGDLSRAEESGKVCRNFLSGNTATAKRVLAAYSSARKNGEAVELLKEQAELALAKEEIAGVRKLEEKLLSAIKSE